MKPGDAAPPATGPGGRPLTPHEQEAADEARRAAAERQRAQGLQTGVGDSEVRKRVRVVAHPHQKEWRPSQG